MSEETKDVHQALMDEAYSWWQNTHGMGQTEFMEKVADQFSELHRIAVIIGNLNYQVCNGGFDQYKGNGYSKWATDVIDFLEENKDYDVVFKDVIQILDEFLNDDDFSEEVDHVLNELERSHPDVSYYLRELVEDREQGSGGRYNHLDTKFYNINDQFIKKMNQWLTEQLDKKD